MLKIIYIVYLIIINFIAFVVYGVDKARAVEHRWRISEATLLVLAILGGAGGALIGMLFFHHKTRHAKFVILVPIFLVLHVILAWNLFTKVF